MRAQPVGHRQLGRFPRDALHRQQGGCRRWQGRRGSDGHLHHQGFRFGSPRQQIRDFHPAGFQLVKARLNVKWLIGDQKWDDVTKTVVVGNNSVVAKGGGWTTAGGGVIALETTYKVPDNAVVGTQLDSGAGTNIVLAAGDWNINPMGVCVTIRQPNPVEAGAGSLEDMGFGSLNSGSGQVFGSLTDPQGSMTNVISGVLGNVLGNMS